MRRVPGSLARDRLALLLFLILVVLLAGRPEAVSSAALDKGSIEVILSFAALVIASRALEFSGLLSRVAVALASRSRSPVVGLVALSYMAAASAALMMNDASILVFVPLARMLAGYYRSERELPVVAVILAVNAGSSLTPIGNPQNLYVWRNYRIPAPVFVVSMAPFAALSLAMLALLIAILYRAPLEKAEGIPPIRVDSAQALFALLLVVLVVIGGELGYIMPVFILALAAYLVWLRRRFALSLGLITVVSLMIVDFKALSLILAPWFSGITISGPRVFLASLGLSQIVSNVPATIMLSEATKAWRPLIIGADLGGLGLLQGSLANIIGVRLGKISMGSYHRYALMLFLPLAGLMAVMSLTGIYP